ncbi:MAG: uroporphyrinogen-III C-methyltransferase, partial [Yersinia sp. (in: enterobacteria)]
MTEQNTPSAPVEETTTAVERHQQPEPEGRREKRTGPILGAIAIALAIALGAGL